MEKNINKKIETYVHAFKDDLKTHMQSICRDERIQNELNHYIDNYEYLFLEKEDFMKRKRTKNVVPYYDRCCAKRSNNEQCTRRRKLNCQFCGTHLKGQPHGQVNFGEPIEQKTKVVLWNQEINGIFHWIDDQYNVYDPVDIIHNESKPKIIAKWEKNEKDEYQIKKEN